MSLPPPGFIAITSAAAMFAAITNATFNMQPLSLWLPEGTHIRLGGVAIYLTALDLTLRSEGSGAVIDAEGASRIAVASDGAHLSVENGVTVMNGFDYAGGCFKVEGGARPGSIALRSARMQGCSAYAAGGALVNGGSFELHDSEIVDTYAYGSSSMAYGGGFVINQGILLLNGSLMRNTTAWSSTGVADGGAIHMNGGVITVMRSTIMDAHVRSSYGQSSGGAFCIIFGNLFIEDSTLVSTSAIVDGGLGSAKGGAIFIGGGDVSIKGSNISSTRAVYLSKNFTSSVAGLNLFKAAYGGGVTMQGGVLFMSDTIISGAEAIAYGPICSTAGGGLHVDAGRATMAGCTISNSSSVIHALPGYPSSSATVPTNEHLNSRLSNAATGGAIYVWTGTLDVSDSLLIDSMASSEEGSGLGGGICVETGQVTLTRVTLSNLLAQAGGSSVHIASGGGITASGGNLLLISVVMRECTASASSQAMAFGGGFSARGGSHQIANCTIEDARVQSEAGPAFGGGIFVSVVYRPPLDLLEAVTSTSVTIYGLDINRSSCTSAIGDAKGGGIHFVQELHVEEWYTTLISSSLTLKRVQLIGCSVSSGNWSLATGSALYLPDVSMRSTDFSAAILHIVHQCNTTADAILPMPNLIDVATSPSNDWPTTSLDMRGLTVTERNCGDSPRLRLVTNQTIIMPCSAYGTISTSADVMGCGPGATCTNAAVLWTGVTQSLLGQTAVSSPSCECESPSTARANPAPPAMYPAEEALLAVLAELAPYSSGAGCSLPLLAQNITYVEEEMMNVRLVKTSDMAPSQQFTLAFGVDGSQWIFGPVHWRIENVSNFPHWLTPLAPLSGVLRQPISSGKSATASIRVEAQSYMLEDTGPDPHVHEIMVALESWSFSTYAVRRSIQFLLFIDATPVAARCTATVATGAGSSLGVSTSGELTLQLATLTRTLVVTVRDVDGLPIYGGHNTLALTTSVLPDGFNASYPSFGRVVYIAGANYSIDVSLAVLGRFTLKVFLDGHPLPFTKTLVGHCGQGSFQGAPVKVAYGVCTLCSSSMVCNASRLNTIDNLLLTPNYWRATNRTTDIYRCTPAGQAERPTSCIGGEVGAFCAEGLSGPLCKVCSARFEYFDKGLQRCKKCSLVGIAAPLVPIAIVLLISSVLLLTLMSASYSPCYEQSMCKHVRHALRMASHIGVIGKLKLALAYFQVVIAVPQIFVIKSSMPSVYDNLMRPFNIVAFNWIAGVAPEPCVGGFSERITIQAIYPFLFVLLIFVSVSTVAVMTRGLISHDEALRDSSALLSRRRSPLLVHGKRLLRGGLASVKAVVQDKTPLSETRRESVSACDHAISGALRALPVGMVILFALIPSVCTAIFSTFTCDRFGSSDLEENGNIQPNLGVESFLHADYSVRCDDNSPSYAALKRLASFLILLWPVGVPILFGAHACPALFCIATHGCFCVH